MKPKHYTQGLSVGAVYIYRDGKKLYLTPFYDKSGRLKYKEIDG